MSEVSERYKLLSDAFAAKIAQVSDWDAPSPCAGWSARDVVGHVVQTQGMFLGFVGEAMGELPSVAEDPVGAWDGARAKVQARLDDPGGAAAEFDGFSGRSTFEAAVDKFLNTDLVMHGWDLARAAGLNDDIAPEDITRIRAYMEPMGDALRNPQAFGPEVTVPDDADEQTKLLGFLGRQA